MDSGGDGTKWALVRALAARNITHTYYLVATCALHNLQTCLKNIVQYISGEGGIDEKEYYLMNYMQMLHRAYNI